MSVKKGLLVVLLVAVLIGAAIAAAFAFPILKVKSFEVTGAMETSQQAIVEASGIQEGENALRVDAAASAQQVLELPWLKKASVHVSPTGNVAIDVEEATAIAFVSRPDGDHLIDDEGREFVIQPHPIGLLEIIDVEEGDAEAMKAAIDVAKAISPGARPRVVAVSAPAEDEVSTVLDDNRSVFWGTATRLKEKSRTFDGVLTRPEYRFDISGAPIIAAQP